MVTNIMLTLHGNRRSGLLSCINIFEGLLKTSVHRLEKLEEGGYDTRKQFAFLSFTALIFKHGELDYGFGISSVAKGSRHCGKVVPFDIRDLSC